MLSHSFERAQTLFNEGRFIAALAVFGDGLPEDSLLALSCAEALNELGHSDRALAVAERIEKHDVGSSSALATARRIIASVYIDRGDRRTAIEYLNSAASLAEAAGDHAEAARASLRLFTCVHHASGRTESSDVLGLAKRLVLRANQPRLLADLHSRVGQAEAQSGNLTAAKRHLDRAVEVLRENPHYVMLARTKLALSSTLALLCQNDAAAAEAKEALRAAEIAGSVALTRLCRANVAQLQFRTGALRAARDTATALLDSRNLPAPFRLAVLETHVAALLESGGCRAEVPEVVEFLAEMEKQDQPSWVAIEAVPTQARVLERLQGIDAARAALESARTRSTGRHPMDSVCRLILIDAEMALRAGRQSEGRALLSQATAMAGERPSVEMLCMLERVRALVAASVGLGAVARVHFGRSERILKGCGLRTEARRTRKLRKRVPEVPAQPRSVRTAYQTLVAVGDAPLLTSLALFPRLLADEFVHAARRLGCDARTELRSSCHSPSEGVEGGCIRLFCGREVEGDVSVVFSSCDGYVESQRVSYLAAAVLQAVQLAEASKHRDSLTDFYDLDVAQGSKRGLYVSNPMVRLLHQIRQVARTDLPVLVRGETGTGKEIVAEEVHALSRRAQGRFVPFNVTAVPRDMLEGQLFGYRRGAFTGAVSDARGLIREAEGGTLFIDEIGELSPDLQPKLLRFLESGEIQPLGERPQRVDVRIVAATNAHLDRLVKEGRFREDLFYRLNVVSLTIPPLRDRREEIPTLLNHFLTQHAKEAGKHIPQLSPQALERLSAYDWPGNVRQLTNELKRIVALCDENEIVDVDQLSEAIRQPAPGPVPTRSTSPADTSVTVRLDRTLQELYDEIERAAIPHAMRLAGNNQGETARRLGITRKGLFLKRKRLGLDEEQAGQAE